MASARKQAYFKNMVELLEEHDKILVVEADFVGSKHLQSIRRELRDMDSTILMGKNTLMRRVIRSQLQKNPNLEALISKLKGNVGFVFTKNELDTVCDRIKKNRVGAPAKAGVIAPDSVSIPAGPTGLEPTQTAFLQALNIASKITKGQIEIINPVQLITKGTKVGSSEAALLQKLKIRPFTYGLEITAVYDQGLCYDAEILEMTSDDLVALFMQAVRNIACISLATNLPALPMVPHVVANAYKNLLAIAVMTDITFKEAEKVKEFLNMDPEEQAKLAAAAAASAAPASGGAAPAPEPEEEEEEEEDGFDMGDLF